MSEMPETAGAPPPVDEKPWEYSLRKYLLLLATMVATVTYSAGFSPPGGVWQEAEEGRHQAGDPILRQTSRHRFGAFFYLNAGAFASSLVAIVLILIVSVQHEMKKVKQEVKKQWLWLAPLHVLRGFMVLDLLTLIGAYTAGIYREHDVPVYTMVLAVLTVVYLVAVLPKKQQDGGGHEIIKTPGEDDDTNGGDNEIKTAGEQDHANAGGNEHDGRKERERPRKVLMLLATFAVSVTYLAGLNAPGGFWNDDAEGDHKAGEPILMRDPHERRLKAFVHLNSTAFFFSLFITVQLLDKNLSLHHKKKFRFGLLFGSIVVALLGLAGAYVAGSCRETSTTIYMTLLGAALPSCAILLLQLRNFYHKKKGNKDSSLQIPYQATTTVGRMSNSRNNNNGDEGNKNSSSGHAQDEATTTADGGINNNNRNGDEEKDKEARSLVLLLATLAATITYQAGLDPPGGLWESDGGGEYLAGDPILRTKNHKRYNAFFYCNSVAFVASLIAIILVKQQKLLKYHALQAAMILDLFGLIGAYAAGSCREVSSSIYAMALAGAVLVYVVIHVLFLTLDKDTNTIKNNKLEVVEKRRKRLLLFAILAATITYQAGLTPPGGFRVKDDESGHLAAGDLVLRYNSQRRYNAFFYCNSVSFMLSMAMILLLVNKNLYRPAIHSHAISVCTAGGMLSLVGAYAAGSTQYLKTSIKIFGLVAAILIVLVAAVLIFVARYKESDNNNAANDDSSKKDKEKDKKKQQRHAERKYLMLLGILVASVTYQAGLKPPGGMWQDDNGHVAGNPVMYNNGRARYLAFFYINSTSFVASIIVIILLLLEYLQTDLINDSSTSSLWSLIKSMNTTILLADLLGLLVAYAVGSSRSWKTTGYVFMLVFTVLAYIGIHVTLAYIVTHGFSSLKKVIKGRFSSLKASTRSGFWRKKNSGATAPDPDESNKEQLNAV